MHSHFLIKTKPLYMPVIFEQICINMSKVLFNTTCLILPFIFILISIQINCNAQRFSTPEECYRPCNAAEPSKTCYYKFTIEYYTTMGPACNVCRTNSFERSKYQSSCECIEADGKEKTIFSINRQFPSPSIQVCQNDKIVVDVENAAEGTSTTIHWHGVFQNGYQYYDGVPHVTQCPIEAPNTFRYQFKAKNPGTHFYHSHSAFYMIDGQQGSLIIRKPKNQDPNGNLYDEDLFDHVIFLSDWMHDPSVKHFPGTWAMDLGQAPNNFLFNGLGQYTDPKTGVTSKTQLAYYNVDSGKRYRFRIINSFATVCPVELTIQGHKCTIIACDGEDLQPTVVDKIISVSGERYDCVLNANQTSGSYWIQMRGLDECMPKKITQLAVLTYNKNVVLPRTTRPTYDNPIMRGGVELNSLNTNDCGSPTLTNNICINQLKSAKSTPSTEQKVYADRFSYISFAFYEFNRTMFAQNAMKRFLIANDSTILTSMVNNNSYSDANSPLISQYEGYEDMCSAPNEISTCTKPCYCANVLHVPYQKLNDILLCDETPNNGLNHPFHLHGYSFQVMAIKNFNNRSSTPQERSQFIRDYETGLQNGKYKQQPRKDTLKIPVGGCAILRFYTDNPGWWLFHCHFLWHTVTGMDIVIHVGEESDMPPVPQGFPVCGSYVPDVYI